MRSSVRNDDLTAARRPRPNTSPTGAYSNGIRPGTGRNSAATSGSNRDLRLANSRAGRRRSRASRRRRSMPRRRRSSSRRFSTITAPSGSADAGAAYFSRPSYSSPMTGRRPSPRRRRRDAVGTHSGRSGRGGPARAWRCRRSPAPSAVPGRPHSPGECAAGSSPTPRTALGRHRHRDPRGVAAARACRLCGRVDETMWTRPSPGRFQHPCRIAAVTWLKTGSPSR